MNELELTGRARTHIVELEQPRCALHYAAATSFLAMRDAAAKLATEFREQALVRGLLPAVPGAATEAPVEVTAPPQ